MCFDGYQPISQFIRQVQTYVTGQRSESEETLKARIERAYGEKACRLAFEWLTDKRLYELTINLSLDNIFRILETNRIMNAYESEKTSADQNSFCPESPYYHQRRTIEDRFFGLVNTIPDKLRPRYAAVNWMLHPAGAAPIYGLNYLILKSRLIEEATFCAGDVYHNNDCNALFIWQLLPYKIIEKFGSILFNQIIRSYQTARTTTEDYIEAHIFRTLTLSDVAKIRIHSSDKQRLQLKQMRWLRSLTQIYSINLEFFDW